MNSDARNTNHHEPIKGSGTAQYSAVIGAVSQRTGVSASMIERAYRTPLRAGLAAERALLFTMGILQRVYGWKPDDWAARLDYSADALPELWAKAYERSRSSALIQDITHELKSRGTTSTHQNGPDSQKVRRFTDYAATILETRGRGGLDYLRDKCTLSEEELMLCADELNRKVVVPDKIIVTEHSGRLCLVYG